MGDTLCYAVPSEVLFRNYDGSPGPQTRSLLLKNTTERTVSTVVSYPFTPNFRLHGPTDQRSELKPNPPHLLLDLAPRSTTKVVVELKPPEPSSPGQPLNLQDVLVVLFSNVRALLVPLHATPQGPGQGQAAAGAPASQQPGAQAAAATANGGRAGSGRAGSSGSAGGGGGGGLWPPQEELDSRCGSFAEAARALYGLPALPLAGPGIETPGPTPAAISPMAESIKGEQAAASVAAAVAVGPGPALPRSGSAGRAPNRTAQAAAGPGSAPASAASPGPVGRTAQAPQPPSLLNGTRPPSGRQRPTAAELPPEGFSGPAPSYDAGDLLPEAGDRDDGQPMPYVLHKTVKVQGRVAVAVAAAAELPGAVATARSLSSSLVPPTNPLSRTSSNGDLAAVGAVEAVGSGSVGGGTRPGSGSGRMAFALGGRLYDARGNEIADPYGMDPQGGPPVTVVDCGDATPRMSRSSSISSTSAARAAPPVFPQPAATAAAYLGSPCTGLSAHPNLTAGLSPSPSRGGMVALAPLKHGGLPVTAALRPGSASSASLAGFAPPPAGTAAALGGRGTAGAGAGGTDDAMRQAALAAAMRELGIADLPAPPRGGRPLSGVPPSSILGTAAAAGGPGTAAPPAVPSYVQYGLPPNYRPSSGRRPPAAGRGVASPPSSSDDDGMDADFEARLQQQVESNVLKSAPVSLPGCGGGGTAGAYLPPRAGAAAAGPGSGRLGSPAPLAQRAPAGRAGGAAGGGGGGGASGRPKGHSGATQDSDYPEDLDFEVALQSQIDSEVAATRAVGALGRAGSASGGAGRGGGAAGGAGAAAGRSSSGAVGVAGAAAGAGAARRSNSTSGASGGGGGAAGSARRASGDAGAAARAPKVSAPGARGSGGVPGSGPAATSQPAPRPAAAGAAGSAGGAGRLGPARAGAGPGAAAAAGGAKGAAAAPGKAADVQRMKANWDALG